MFFLIGVVDPKSRVFRVVDTTDSGVNVLDEATLIEELTRQGVQLENAKILDGKLVGYPAPISKYGVDGDETVYVVCEECRDEAGNVVGYNAYDNYGCSAYIERDYALAYANSAKFANAIFDEATQLFRPYRGGTFSVVAPEAAEVIRGTSEIQKLAECAVNIGRMENEAYQYMTAEQIKHIQEYYKWHTIYAYKEIACSLRMGVSPNKVAQLERLKGAGDWTFAGVYDGGYMGAGTCALGHTLRYIFTAVNNSNGQELIFGETCVGDFFELSPAALKALTKAKNTMSSELKEIGVILETRALQEYMDGISEFVSLLSALGDNAAGIVGSKAIRFAWRFMELNMPIPYSLIDFILQRLRSKLSEVLVLLGASKEYAESLVSEGIELGGWHTTLADYIQMYMGYRVYGALIGRRRPKRDKKDVANRERLFARMLGLAYMDIDYSTETMISLLRTGSASFMEFKYHKFENMSYAYDFTDSSLFTRLRKDKQNHTYPNKSIEAQYIDAGIVCIKMNEPSNLRSLTVSVLAGTASINKLLTRNDVAELVSLYSSKGYREFMGQYDSTAATNSTEKEVYPPDVDKCAVLRMKVEGVKIDDRSIEITRDICSRDMPYEKLSEAQKLHVDRAWGIIIEGKPVNGAFACKDPDIEKKMRAVQDEYNTKLGAEIRKVAGIAFDIIDTCLKTGVVTSKQAFYIDKAYKVISEKK